MQVAIQAKMPRNQAFFGSLCAYFGYVDCIKDNVQIDPAAGSGNFLTETYISLRRLENQVLQELSRGQISFGDADWNPIQVSISQFYGIEINDFAVTVAKTALWIAESQMMKETESIVLMQLEFLPLKTNAGITEGNALRLNWEDVVPKNTVNFIMGNPPFIGARLMTKEQKGDLAAAFGNITKGINNIDYVSGWYKKASDFIANTAIRVAFVSTNSIVQGEQAAILWKPLFEAGLHIDFAYHTFRWDSEAKLKAHVHCIIVGFSAFNNNSDKKLFLNDSQMKIVKTSMHIWLMHQVFLSPQERLPYVTFLRWFLVPCQTTEVP